MTKPKISNPETCLNCSEILVPGTNYCPQCGQKSRPARVKLKFFLSEFLHDYFTVDSKVYRTLFFLIAKPGKLTIEFCEGKRARHIKPFRLFLFVSFSYFFLLAITVEDDTFLKPVELDIAGKLESTPENGQVNPVPEAADTSVFSAQADTLTPSESAFVDWISTQEKRVSGDPIAFKKGLFRAGSYAVFFLLPLFAFFLKIAHFRRAPFYVDHLIHSIHIHSFLFLLFLVFNIFSLSFSNPGYGWLVPISFGYLVFSLRNTYHQSIGRALFKAILIIPVYTFFIILAIAIVAIISFALA